MPAASGFDARALPARKHEKDSCDASSLEIAELRSFQQDPLADERRDAAKLDASSFGRRQEADGVQIDEPNLLELERDRPPSLGEACL